MFIAEFGTDFDRQKALEGTPWLVGRYAAILQKYDESLKPSNISFSAVTMWVRILDLPFGWMNAKRGARVVGLIGEVQKVEADLEGKVSGPFLRARVVIDISKPLRRCILLKKDKSSAPRNGLIFSVKTCLSSACLVVTLGIFSQLVLPLRPGMQMGNCRMNIRNSCARGQEKKTLSFAQVAAESFGSLSGSGRKKDPKQPLCNSQGSGKEPTSNQFGASGGSDDGVLSSMAGNHASGLKVTKSQQLQPVHQTLSKRKGLNAKAPVSSTPALEFHSISV
jgi:hypothetical protein